MRKIKKNLALLRYPGGKSRLLGHIHERIAPLVEKGQWFLEPFVGGGSVSLSVVDRFQCSAWINDLDPNIFAFWNVMAFGSEDEVSALCYLLHRGASLNLFDEERERVNSPSLSKVERAYHAIFFCKTTHNGMFTASPIGGRNQENKKWKIDCQFKPDKMAEKIHRIRSLLAGKTVVTNYSALAMVEVDMTTPVYLDPPYYVAGKKCYPTYMTQEEHEGLARLLRRRDRWVLSYDDCAQIRDLYSWATINEISTRYSMASHGEKKNWGQKKELLITP